MKRLKYTKIISLIMCMVFMFNAFASQNFYVKTDDYKKLEINEDYIKEYNINDESVNIEDIGTDYKIIISAKLIKSNNISFDDKDLNYNIKKLTNQTYNTKDYYIIGSSNTFESLNTSWYRELTNSSNIGKGYIKENDTYLTKREYGTGNDENTQNKILYTNNKVINAIQGTDYIKNFNITNKSLDNLSFSFTIDKINLSNIRYLYIGNIININESGNTTYYTNAISEPIDLDLYKTNSSNFFGGGGNGNGGLMKSPMLLGSPSPTSVSVSVDKIPKVDVMLSNTDNMLDTTNFKTDLIASLSQLGVDTSDIEFIESETNVITTESVDVSTIFNTWKKFGNGGNWSISNYGGSTTIQNSENTIGITGWMSQDTPYATDMTIEYDFMNMDNDDDYVGILLRAKIDDDKSNTSKPLDTRVSGYLFWEGGGNDDVEWKKAKGLWKMNNCKLACDGGDGGIEATYGGYGTRTHNFENQVGITCLKQGALNEFLWKKSSYQWYHRKYEITGKRIRVWADGTLICDIEDNTDNPIGCGSFALINMSQPVRFKNFKVEYKTNKSYSEISQQQRWRENAIKVVNNISYLNDTTLASPSIITQTLNENIKYMMWGTNTNKSNIESFIHKIDNGRFTHYKESEGSSYHEAIGKTAEYIKYLIEQEYYSQYLLVGNKVNLNVSPPSMKTGAISADFPSGRWQVNHDYTYFTNNMGLSNNMGEYSPNLSCDFDKVGLYTINFDDELLKNVYVHRMPIADFNIEIDDTNLTFTNNSYDLDKEDIDNGYGKGIKLAKFTWKNLTTDPNNWHEGLFTTWDKSSIIVIKLEVEDFQEQKNYCVKYIGHGEPQALFNLEKQIVSNFSTIKAHDTSYDPKGASIVFWNYELKKGGVFIASSSQANPQFATTGLALGTYTLYLQVKNEVGDSSNTYSKQLVIVEDLDNPYFVANPPSCDWKEKQDIVLTVLDYDSGIQKFRYGFSQNKNTIEESELSDFIATESEITISTPLSDMAEYYLFVNMVDNANNTTQKGTGIYHIKKNEPVATYERSGGGGGNGSPVFSQAYLDSLNKKPEEPIKPVYKEKIKRKDLLDFLTEVYTDWKDQNNIKSGKKLDIVDFIKAVYEDFDKNKSNVINNKADIVDFVGGVYEDWKDQNNIE